ncbi:unnamed protein product [Acanthoscelides obtectus]|uniref:Uncharacterized protein n=1 Tax=Acanthoscelides obtectus TaxID=200917 RepID=A0A9P0LVD0_ACAOB|nr:unnamed protein product [Acanthoscelides obtectus]CAK1648251.1 hypothetical protein AOBTE_LOCUS15616 [Acanthoscelides obtectus]
MYDRTLASIMNKTNMLSGSVLQKREMPWTVALNCLYIEFFEILQGHSGRHDILEVVSDLGRCCSDALKIIQGFKSKVAVTQIEEELCIERERNTWRLIFILYQDRLLTQGLMEDKANFSNRQHQKGYIHPKCKNIYKEVWRFSKKLTALLSNENE